MNIFKRNRKGVALIEVLIAGVILAVVLVGFLQGLNVTLLGTHRDSKINSAQHLAQSQMEYIKSQPFNSLACNESISDAQAFSDSFEVALDKWDANGATLWDLKNDRSHDGTNSVKANLSNDGYLTSDNIDLSDTTLAYLDFWFMKSDIGPTDITLYFYDGSSYHPIDELDDNGPDNTWLHYNSGLIDMGIYDTPNFRIRFHATLGPEGRVWVDELVLAGSPYEIIDDFYSPENSDYDVEITVDPAPHWDNCSALQLITVTVSHTNANLPSQDYSVELQNYKIDR